MKIFLPIASTFVALFVLWHQLPMADNPSYFDFADTRILWTISHAGDVLSNIPFFFVGLLGLLNTCSKKSLLLNEYKHCLSILALGTILTCFGSIYFHLNPNLYTLFWDRLPMTIGFTGLIGLLITDRIGLKIGFFSCYLLVAMGLFSIIGWHNSWLDLRPYLSLQYGCLIFALLIVFFTPSNVIKNSSVLIALILYVLAKVTELYDRIIFDQLHFMSGHTLKHLLAAIAILVIFQPLTYRTTSR